ncbi:MAG: type IV toxin-antitoxin system AbiEi family antitoxin [Rickettsiales bacterium]
MATEKEQKIKKLLALHRQGTVSLAAWLVASGISTDLQAYYRKSGWLQSIGRGAFIRPNDTVNWQGGLYALQSQSHLPVHVGALTALSMKGMAHYVRVGGEPVFLFSSPNTTLPTWFRNYDWGVRLHHISTSILPNEVGIMEHEEKTFTIRIASPERAIMECLHLAPDKLDLVECYQVIEGLTTLRPKLLQSLLEQCNSIKVKRVFLYMAKKAGHDWYKRLDSNKLDLGTGSRTITKGVYDAEFAITVPEELHKL